MPVSLQHPIVVSAVEAVWIGRQHPETSELVNVAAIKIASDRNGWYAHVGIISVALIVVRRLTGVGQRVVNGVIDRPRNTSGSVNIVQWLLPISCKDGQAGYVFSSRRILT